jgi:hypothetical protein
VPAAPAASLVRAASKPASAAPALAPRPEPAAPSAEGADEAEPNWPSATDEAAYLGGPREEISLPVLPPEPVRAAVDTEPVPPVEELIQQIPAEVRATLEELFRARFNRVMRAKPKTA